MRVLFKNGSIYDGSGEAPFVGDVLIEDDTILEVGGSIEAFCQLMNAKADSLGMSDTRLSRKWNLYARGEWRWLSQWGLQPVVGYQHQGNFSELVYGADVKWYVNERPSNYLAFSAGLLGRHSDALSVNLAVDWLSWTFAFSYDANLSTLAEASHTLGAFEIGVIYRIGKKDNTKRALPCPII